jgi:hypothetical protein
MRYPWILARLAVGAPIALFAASAAKAQQQGAPQASWEFTIAPYAWGAGVNGTVGVGDRTADVDISVGDIIDQVDIAVMLATELRHGPLIFLLDGFYVELSDDAAVPVPPLTSANVGERQLMLQPEVGFTIVSGPTGALDLLGGIRYWHFRTTLDLLKDGTSAFNTEDTKDWVDAVLGARYRLRLGARWPVMILGDVGTGGSKFTWQALGSLGFDLARCCTLIGGYRYLHFDYEHSGFTEDLGMSGPLLGLAFRF